MNSQQGLCGSSGTHGLNVVDHVVLELGPGLDNVSLVMYAEKELQKKQNPAK